jgi:hypothetical protein
MKRAWREVAGAAEVRAAAAAWRENGAIDAATLAAIQADYPDPRLRLHPVWRVLVFLLVSVAVGALFWSVLGKGEAIATKALVFAALLAGAAEAVRGTRFSGTGADASAAFWSAVFAVGGFGFLLGETLKVPDRTTFTLVALLSAIVFGAAAWRWGLWFHAGVAAASLFVLLGRFPFARLTWIAAAAFLIPVLDRRRDSAALAPPHRRSLSAVLAACAAALYAAVNLYSLDRKLVEMLAGAPPLGPSGGLERLLATIATVLLPAVFLVWGVRARRRLLLDLGVGMAALSVVTWRHYQPIGPAWAFLAACGVALLLTSLWLGRRLRMSPRGERRGWTASLLSSETDAGGGEAAAVLAGVAPRTHPDSGPRQDLTTGGGQFGGGGATGSY